jgi:hypothetical protein
MIPAVTLALTRIRSGIRANRIQMTQVASTGYMRPARCCTPTTGARANSTTTAKIQMTRATQKTFSPVAVQRTRVPRSRCRDVAAWAQILLACAAITTTCQNRPWPTFVMVDNLLVAATKVSRWQWDVHSFDLNPILKNSFLRREPGLGGRMVDGGPCDERLGGGNAGVQTCAGVAEIAVWLNGLSRMSGLIPAYTFRGDELTLRREADGYRLMTREEWRIITDDRSLLGGDELVVLGDAYDGGDDRGVFADLCSGAGEIIWEGDRVTTSSQEMMVAAAPEYVGRPCGTAFGWRAAGDVLDVGFRPVRRLKGD